MKLLHRGLTIELAPDDPRIPVFETLLFGRPLPPPAGELPSPMPMPELADTVPPEPPPPEPEVEQAPAVVVPERHRAFWEVLSESHRRELALLADGPRRPVEVEAALGLTQRALMGQHSRINRLGYEHRFAQVVRSKGRGRDGRRYWIDEKLAVSVKALAASR